MNLTDYWKSWRINIQLLVGICAFYPLTFVHAQFVPSIEEEEREDLPPIGETPPVKKTKYSFKRSFTDLYPHPKTALYASLTFPGGGQIYNKQYWKVPLVWGAYGGVIYLINFNTQQYRSLRQAVIDRLAGRPDEFPFIPNVQTLRRFRDEARLNMERSYFALIFVHLLSAGEAFTAAHLKTFDISEDLTFQVKTGLIPSAAPALGMSLVVNFH